MAGPPSCTVGVVLALLLPSTFPFAAVADGGFSRAPAPTAPSFAVVGYLPEWRFGWEPDRWGSVSAHLSHLILFSLEVTASGGLSALDRFPSPAQLRLAQEARQKVGTRLLVCLGGNGRSGGFGPAVGKKKTRRKLAENLALFCEQHGLDGVDFNWEYPDQASEWKGLFHLLADTRAAFERHRMAASGASAEDTRRTPVVITMAYYPDGQQER
eukprot:RCo032125